MSDIINAGIAIDSTSAVKAKQDLENLAGASVKVDSAMSKVEQGSMKTGKSLATLGSYAKQVSESSTQMAAQLTQLNATQSRQEALLRAIGSSLSGTTAAYKASTSAVQTGAQAHKAYVDQLDQTIAKQKAMGISAGQTAAAMRQVPAQFTDIVTSLQGGQNPLTVLLQQGGQLKDSFGGAGAAASALGGYVAGLINPFTVGAAAVGLLAYAAHQGSEEMNAYSKALILTGGASGKTAGELEALAIRISATTGAQGLVADALAEAVSSGKIASSALESVGAASVSMSRVLGISIEDAVGQFAKLSGEPAKASAELNKQYHFLNASTYERIRALDDQGRKEEATALAQKTYADATVSRMRLVQEQAGYLSKALTGVGDVASGMWRTIAGAASSIGAQQTSGARLAEAQRMVDFLQKYGGTAEKKMEAQAELAAASEVDRLSRRSALALAERQRGEEEKQAAIDRWANQRKSNRTQADIRKELIDQTIADGKLLGKAQKDIDDEIARINANHKDSKPAAVKAYQDDAGTKYVQDLREQEAALYRRLAVGEKLTGAAKELAEFEQKIADLQGKGRLTKDQKDLLGRQGEIRAILQEMGMLEKLGQIEDEEAKKKAKRAQDAITFQDRAAQIQEQIETAQAARREGYARTLGGFGKSDAEQQRIQEVNGLYRESVRLQEQLTKATPKSQLGSDNYLAEIASIKGSLAVSLDDHRDYYKRLQEMQGNWSLGASSALATYAEESANVARQMQQATGSAFKGMEDQLVSLATTGKANFKSLIDSVIADTARLAIRQSVTGPLAGALNGLLGGAGRAAFSQTSIGSSGFGTGLAYGNQDMGQFFADGGYTGPGGKYQAAGIVHAGEFVINAASTRKLGLDFLGRLNGYADGGFVSPPPAAIMPNYGAIAAMRSGGGGMGNIQVVVENHGTAAQAEVKQTPTEDGGMQLRVILREVTRAVKNEIAGDIAAGGGAVSRAMEYRYGLRTEVR